MVSDIGFKSALTATPPNTPASTRDWASVSASTRVRMKAPLPYFTSITSRSSPSANFLLMMLAVMRAMLGTVPVTSRKA